MDDKKQLDLSPGMRAAVAEAEAIHAGAMTYMRVVVLPFAESMHRAMVSDITRLANAFQEAERRRISR